MKEANKCLFCPVLSYPVGPASLYGKARLEHGFRGDDDDIGNSGSNKRKSSANFSTRASTQSRQGTKGEIDRQREMKEV